MARTLSYARAQLTTAATALLTLGLLTTPPATADQGHGLRADGHAPIGVMGDHMHKKGEFMFSYRFMRMDMEGSRIGTDGVTPEEIVTTVPNIFDINPGMPGVQPPFLRVVPTRMTMDMHMFGAMYAPTDDITLMVMLPYITKEMDHVTFQGPMGTNRLGTFTTKSEGIGDVKFGGLIRLYDDAIHHFHANLMFSAPTGSITEEDDVLTPFNTRPTLRLPYPMQLGTGTWDIHPGITYTARLGDLSWGGQYMAELRLESENDEGYSVGDKHKLTGWLAYQFVPEVSASVRLAYQTQDSIDGIDPEVTAPVQTANPDFQGGDRLDLLVGINSIVTQGALKGHRFAIEGGVPVYQDLNGPQMETDWLLTLGWQYAF